MRKKSEFNTSSEMNKSKFKNKSVQQNKWDGCYESFINSKYQFQMTYPEYKKLWIKGKVDV
jgi:hypothetical protein